MDATRHPRRLRLQRQPRSDLLKQLLDLNHAVAAREKKGDPVTAPGVPTCYGDAEILITADCIRP